MESYLFAAGCLALALGLIHSVLGEVLIFRHMRDGGIIPTKGRPIIKERHVRILWASWHLVTIFGWGFAVILLWYSLSPPGLTDQTFIKNTILLSMLSGSLLVLIATKGRHPGWIVLFAIVILLGVS